MGFIVHLHICSIHNIMLSGLPHYQITPFFFLLCLFLCRRFVDLLIFGVHLFFFLVLIKFMVTHEKKKKEKDGRCAIFIELALCYLNSCSKVLSMSLIVQITWRLNY